MPTCICVVPAHEWDPSGKCDPWGPATRTRWGNGGKRLLTPEVYTAKRIEKEAKE